MNTATLRLRWIWLMGKLGVSQWDIGGLCPRLRTRREFAAWFDGHCGAPFDPQHEWWGDC